MKIHGRVWWSLLPFLCVLGLLVLFWQGLATAPERTSSTGSALIGQPAPILPTKAVVGTELATVDMLADGDVTLVNFWASWCPPCRAEHPRLMELSESGVSIIGVNLRDIQDQAASFLDKDGNPYLATGFDKTGRISVEWGVLAPPETFIVDGDGIILHRFQGPLVGSDVEQRFLAWLEQAQAKTRP